MNISFKSGGGAPSGNLLARVCATLVSLLLLGAALMFSAVFFVVLAVVGVCAWGYLWWKMRAIKKQMRTKMEEQAAFWQKATSQTGEAAEGGSEGAIIEGEAIRVDETEQRM